MLTVESISLQVFKENVDHFPRDVQPALHPKREAVISAKNHKRQRRKRQSVTAKREKSQTPQ